MTHPEIQRAIDGQRVLRFAYFGQANGTRFREVSPYEIVTASKGHALLLGWDHEREGLRQFRIAGIAEGMVAPDAIYVAPTPVS